MNQKQKQQIKKIAKKMKIKYLYLFGSQARGKIKPASDFDFAVKFNKISNSRLKFKARLKLMSELSRILKRDEVDVVDVEEASPLLNFNVIKDGKVVYSQNERERIMDKVRAINLYFDRQYYFARYFKKAISKMAAAKI